MSCTQGYAQNVSLRLRIPCVRVARTPRTREQFGRTSLPRRFVSKLHRQPALCLQFMSATPIPSRNSLAPSHARKDSVELHSRSEATFLDWTFLITRKL